MTRVRPAPLLSGAHARAGMLALLGAALIASIACAHRREIALRPDPNSGPIGVGAGSSPAAGAPDEAQVVRAAAMLPVLNRTEYAEAPVVLGTALADALAAKAPFRLVRPEEVPDRIQPLYELGVVSRMLAEVDESGRTSPEVARLVGQGLKVDAVLVTSVTFFQQFVDHMPGGKPGEAYTTVVGGEIHLVDSRTGMPLWTAAKIRRDTGLLGYPTFQETARGLAQDLLATLPN